MVEVLIVLINSLVGILVEAKLYLQSSFYYLSTFFSVLNDRVVVYYVGSGTPISEMRVVFLLR